MSNCNIFGEGTLTSAAMPPIRDVPAIVAWVNRVVFTAEVLVEGGLAATGKIGTGTR